MLCMETLLKIRRLHHKEKCSQREIAKRLGISRVTVIKYLKQALTQPPSYSRRPPQHPKLGAFMTGLTARLREDLSEPKGKRRRAQQHFEWLKVQGFTGKYCCVAVFVRQFYAQHQPSSLPVFIKQTFAPGEAYQFDWSIEKVQIAGVVTKVNVAHFRLCHSRAFFVVAYPTQQMDMLMDAHNQAFAFFGGVPERGIYDNMKTAVKRIGQGKERVFNDTFLCMMAHFLIQPTACTPASGWEKGQVERQVKMLRQRCFQPMLAVSSWDELNAYLNAQCLHLLATMKHPERSSVTLSDALAHEQPSLSSFHAYPGQRLEMLRVNSQSLVRIDNHHYSVPVAYAGKTVRTYLTAHKLRVMDTEHLLAEHARCFERGGITYDPFHYLPLLERKPGALRNGEPFVEWPLPPAIKQLQTVLLKQPKGDKAMVRVLSLLAEYAPDVALTAAELALEEGRPTPEAVLNIIHRLSEPLIPKLYVDDIPLTHPPCVNCHHYDALLTGEYYAAH